MLKRLFLNDKFILFLILFNAVIIFLSGFDNSMYVKKVYAFTDSLITVLFITEISIKIRYYGIKEYFGSNWNRFDVILVVLSLPSLFSFLFQIEITDFSFLLVFRVTRVFKSFRFLKFIPDIEHLIKGVQRALKASVLILIAFVIYIFIIGIFSFYLFKNSSSEYYGDPLTSLYTTFKIFTVEGWYEIPESVTNGFSPLASVTTNLFFIFILITGGIFGLSLVNSIFVDAMVSDNNDELETKIDSLEKTVIDLRDLIQSQNGQFEK